jgi:RND family efflux transporter, MFP subunit
MTRFIIAAFSFVFLFSSCETKKATIANGPRKSGPISVEGFVVEVNSISESVEVPGTLLPFEETQIKSEVSGRVVELNLQEGTIVKKGALLVKLFDQDLQAQMRKLAIQLKIAEKTVERQKELLAINGISQQEFDLNALTVDNLKADIESLRIAISKTQIRAPYDGTIGLRNVSLGAYISPAEVITSLRQVNQLKLEFSIPEKYAKNISKGFLVEFKVDGGQSAHKATVMATEGSVEQSTRTLKVKAMVDKSHPELVPGTFAKVKLQLGKDDKALMIPTQSIIPQARNKQVIVFKKDSALFTVVETGIRDSVHVQVISGLKPGDTIVTTGLMAVRPNAKIKITKVKHYQK